MDLSILFYSVLIWAIVYVLIRVVREKRKHNWKVIKKWDGLHREGRE